MRILGLSRIGKEKRGFWKQSLYQTLPSVSYQYYYQGKITVWGRNYRGQGVAGQGKESWHSEARGLHIQGQSGLQNEILSQTKQEKETLYLTNASFVGKAAF